MNTALILSGGNGSRLGGDIPKQYMNVGGRSLISYSIKTFLRAPEIDMVWIVAKEEWQDEIKDIFEQFENAEILGGFSRPGDTRQLSIYNGICDIAEYRNGQGADISSDFVLIHDAARPLLSVLDVESYFKELEGHDGLMPILPMKDTVYLSPDGKSIEGLLDRGQIFSGQAPEIFNLKKYLTANEALIEIKAGQIADGSKILTINGSTEVAYMAGMDIVLVPGNEENFKITTMEDLTRFKSIILDEIIF